MNYLHKLSAIQRIFALLLCLLALAAGIYSGLLQQRIVNPALAPLDDRANSALQHSLLLSSASFATARLIDRGIAFVSEAEVGVGVASVKPGQLLKPLQDMAVRYSDLMVLAMTSVGLQLFLLEFGKVAALPLFGSGILLSAVLLLLGPASWRSSCTQLLRIFVALLLVIRIGVPLAAFGVAELSDWVLEPQRIAAEAALSGETAALQRVDQPLHSVDEGSFSWLRQMAAQANDMFAAVKSFSDSMVEKLIQLIVVYSLQTLIFPLLSLYLLWQLGRWFVRRPLAAPVTPESAIPVR
ncbi:MAG: hypothetical protein KKE30_11635 [Gammaproteobacteria bacterium]|nr:hypothetical protein [Gammaproteobacteria bacterium]MBU1556123.1 hypothetical protein [Gammaproteobacteria bacterium]MBU2069987.1 hypothetical protein [Gammaproteobacteria bacterium]MBU2185132.1 hypothetical protein [Gammaproteobacteria bacterium]MBU2207000.1 hypothetical protein [Gammaproteobacteria bacterium]